jgi:hypothetical protein
MIWLAVDKNGKEYVYSKKPIRDVVMWLSSEDCVELPEGFIEKLIGKKLKWEDEAVEAK